MNKRTVADRLFPLFFCSIYEKNVAYVQAKCHHCTKIFIKRIMYNLADNVEMEDSIMAVLMIILSVLVIVGGINCIITPVATFSALGWMTSCTILRICRCWMALDTWNIHLRNRIC